MKLFPVILLEFLHVFVDEMSHFRLKLFLTVDGQIGVGSIRPAIFSIFRFYLHVADKLLSVAFDPSPQLARYSIILLT